MKWKWQTIISSLLLICCTVSAQLGTVLNYTFRSCPQVGVLSSNVTGTTNKAHIIKDTLGSLYCRFTAISAEDWAGSSGAYETFRDSGLISHVVLNVGVGGVDPEPWITAITSFDLTDLGVMVNDFFDTYPEYEGGIMVLDNEELIDAFHEEGRLFQYTAIADVVQPICRAHNVKLSNGGFGNFFAINGYVFRWIKANPNYGQTVADDFGDIVFTSPGQYNAANTPNSNPTLEAQILGVDTVVSSDDFDILNIHIYNPPGDQTGNDTATYAWQNEVWRYYKECFSNANTDRRREVACNETGQRGNSNASLVTNMLNMSWRLRFLVFDWWSGNGVPLSAEPLTEDDGTQKSNGAAYNSFNARYTNRPLP